MSIKPQFHITLRSKKAKGAFLATGIAQLAREVDLHENTVRKMYSKAILAGGYFENDFWQMIVTWEVVKGNRGFSKRKKIT